METNGDLIRSKRALRRITQGQASKAARIHVMTLVDIETNKVEISDACTQRIVTAIDGVPVPKVKDKKVRVNV